MSHRLPKEEKEVKEVEEIKEVNKTEPDAEEEHKVRLNETEVEKINETDINQTMTEEVTVVKKDVNVMIEYLILAILVLSALAAFFTIISCCVRDTTKIKKIHGGKDLTE